MRILELALAAAVVYAVDRAINGKSTIVQDFIVEPVKKAADAVVQRTEVVLQGGETVQERVDEWSRKQAAYLAARQRVINGLNLRLGRVATPAEVLAELRRLKLEPPRYTCSFVEKWVYGYKNC